MYCEHNPPQERHTFDISAEFKKRIYGVNAAKLDRPG